MNSAEMEKRWNGLSAEIISGIAEWRQQHPRATFREIEDEVDKRLAVLRVRMLSDAAISSTQAEWEGRSPRVVCPSCGTKLEKKGKKKRKLETRGGQEVELEREYGVCPKCGQGIFPPG
jgi:YgiT-type zinc finger domain-containing protein